MFFGKNKLMQLAFGQQPECEIEEGIHKLSLDIVGQRGILLTNDTLQNVKKYLDTYHPEDFATSGFKATKTITLYRDDTNALKGFAPSIEAHLRSLGMPSILKDGKIQLLGILLICLLIFNILISILTS